jgi:outer membrane cobalamin receptor
MRLHSLLIPCLAASLVAQTPIKNADPDTDASELMALLNTPINVASAKAMTFRESPGVLSVISREEIAAIAPRTIMDVLRLVPGFQFGYESQGETGLMARAFWASEGKALILWNNLDISDLLYGNTDLGDRFPLDQIKRIEIIRGPGSAIYGGSAELVVIKIISMDADDIRTVAGSAGYRQAKGGFNAKEFGGMWADQIAGAQFTVGAENTRSSLGTGDTFGYLNATSDRLTVNFLGENMYKLSPTNEYPANSDIYETQWVSQNALVKYRFGGPDFSITPFANYTKSIPWIDTDNLGDYTRREVARMKTGFDGLFITGKWGLGFGFANYTDHAAVSPQSTSGTTLTNAGATQFSQQDSSAYFEGSYSGDVNLVAGGRYDHNSIAGDKFVPRFAITKTWASWYVKLLFAEAFRTPDVLNQGQAMSPAGVLPETTRNYEMEIGNQFGANLISGNIYWAKLSNALVYMNSSAGVSTSGGYVNGPGVSGYGLELTYKYKASWGFVNLGYAHDLTANNVAQWAVPGDSHTAVDVAKDQATALARIHLTKNLDASVNATYLGSRFAYNAAGTIQESASNTLLNANLSCNLAPFTIILGACDLLNQKAMILPGYNGGIEGLEGQGLEAFIKVKYGFR